MNDMSSLSPSSTEPSEPPAPAFPPAPRTPPRRPWSELGRLVAAVAVGAIVGASVMGASGRGISLPSPAIAVLGQSSRASQNSDAAAAAIKDVIQRANDEQAQAIANNDPSVMRDTATPSHYQDLVQTNDQLTSAGITSIKLLKLEWGTISVSGSNAKATTYETWQSTFSDGSIDRSRDQNDYTLVLQNGKWLVSGDDQPSQDGSTGSTVPSAPDPNVAPVSPSRDTSSNWSGYAAAGGTFTSVTGTWTVPDPSTTSAGADATWVGIGGVSSHDLIQAGTETTMSGRSSARFDAWIELLPRSQQIVPLTVSPGDSVTVTIAQQQGDQWLISMKDSTTGGDYSTIVTYASTNSSVEWVEEAPSGGRRILPLDDFGSVRFTDAKTTANGKTMTVAQAGGRPLTMINGARQPLAQPSPLGSDGSSFTITRTAASSNVVPSFPGRTRRDGG